MVVGDVEVETRSRGCLLRSFERRYAVRCLLRLRHKLEAWHVKKVHVNVWLEI